MLCACLLYLVLASCRSVAPAELRIPKILHHIYLSGKASYDRATSDVGAVLSQSWRTSCVAAYHDWEHRFWTEEDAVAYITSKYPWFLETYSSFKHFVLRGDSLRYIVLHGMGGLYLDLDVECYPAADSIGMLSGFDIVLQGHREGEPVINSMMASSPGQPIMLEAIQEIQRRAEPQKMAQYSDPNIRVLHTVGPRMLSAVVEGVVGHMPYEDLVSLPHKIDDTTLRIYGSGTWYQPCRYDNCTCHQHLALAQVTGLYPPGIVGYHHFTSTWASEMNRDHKRCRMHQTAYVTAKPQARLLEGLFIGIASINLLLGAVLALVSKLHRIGRRVAYKHSPAVAFRLSHDLQL